MSEIPLLEMHQEAERLRARVERLEALLRKTWNLSEFWFYVPRAIQEEYYAALADAGLEASE